MVDAEAGTMENSGLPSLPRTNRPLLTSSVDDVKPFPIPSEGFILLTICILSEGYSSLIRMPVMILVVPLEYALTTYHDRPRFT